MCKQWIHHPGCAFGAATPSGQQGQLTRLTRWTGTIFPMIIHPPRTVPIRDEILISSRIEVRATTRKVPDNLWFRFPSSSQPSDDADPFVVALLLFAMQSGEDIEVRSSLSRKIYEGLQQYQRVFHSWFPDRFQLIEIHCSQLRDDVPLVGTGKGAAFSGGVDSFYTFLSLRKELTHTIFMAGFDMPANLVESIGELIGSFSTMMQESGIEFIAGSTNIRMFVNAVDWTNAHGPALIATALFFKHRLSDFYIPSSYKEGAYPNWGTHPDLDPLLSSESMNIVHHGSHVNRVQKLKLVAQAPMSYDRLRVCWIQDIGLRNCGRCEKCVRTQIALDIVGALSKYKTFDKRTLDHSQIRQLRHRTHQSRVFARELMREAIQRGKLLVWGSLGFSLLRREVFYRTRATVK